MVVAVVHAKILIIVGYTQHVLNPNHQNATDLVSYAYYVQTIYSHIIDYSPVKNSTLINLADYCTGVTSPALYQVPLELAHLVVSLVLVATKATFMGKVSSTVTCWMMSE